MLNRAAARRPAEWVGIVVLAGFWFLNAEPLFVLRPGGAGDFILNVAKSAQAVRDLSYPAEFFYPLPFVLFLNAFAEVPRVLGQVFWLSLMTMAYATCFLSARVLLPLDSRNGWSVAAVALLGVGYVVQWDLRASNVNLVVLALCTAGMAWRDRQPLVAGVVLAAATAIKIYPVTLLAWFIWQRRWKTLASVGLSLLILGVLLPAALLGPDASSALTGSWLDRVGEAARPGFAEHFHAFVVSSALSLQILLETFVNVRLAHWAVVLMWLAWGGLMCAYGVVVLLRSTPPSSSRQREAGWEAALDASMLLLLPLPVSPVLQPHQAAVMLLPALILSSVALGRQWPGHVRICSAVALAYLFLFDVLGPSAAAWRGVGLLVGFFAFATTLLLIRNLSQPLSQATAPWARERVRYSDA